MLIKVYYCELRPVVIILPVYISLDESTSPNDVKPAASGKLVNGFRPPLIFSIRISLPLSLLPGQRWTHLATQSGRRVNHSDGLERILQLMSRQ